MYSSDDHIISRENYWKEKLMTRIHGLIVINILVWEMKILRRI
jgi:hypothetical protein